MSVLCSEQPVTRGVCSDTHLYGHTHTYLLIKSSRGETLGLYQYKCVLSGWMRHSGIPSLIQTGLWSAVIGLKKYHCSPLNSIKRQSASNFPRTKIQWTCLWHLYLMRKPNCLPKSMWFSLFGSFIRSKPHLSCPFSRLSIYPSLLWMDSSSVCIWSHFYSRTFLFIYLRADCSLFWCPIVQLSLIFKTLECHLPQIPSHSIPASLFFFQWLR